MIPFHLNSMWLLNFHGVFIVLIEKNIMKSYFRFYIKLYKNTFNHWEDSWDLLVHGKVEFGTSSGHDEDLIISVCYKTVHDFRICYEIVLKFRMRDFTHLRKEGIKLVNFYWLKSAFFYLVHWSFERFKYRFEYKIQKPNLNIKHLKWIFFKYELKKF